MSEAIHPSELNIFQQYSRTVKLAKTTSRMKNPAWYQDALDLDVQIHCYLKDSGAAECYLYVKSQNACEKIQSLSSRQLEQREELEKFIHQALELDAAAHAKSLGVILYLADELSLAGLGPEHQNPIEMDNLRAMMVDDPREVLDDKTVSVETHSWRLFPYSGAAAGDEFATAVAVSRRRSDTLRVFREVGNEINLPIQTCAISAPLCALASLPLFATAKESGTIAVFSYEQFTLLAFLNSHCNLMMLRFMPHPNGASAPSNLGPAVMATATAFELENPEIHVVSMVGHDVEGLVGSLQGGMPESDVAVVNAEELLKKRSLPLDLPIEIMVATEDFDGDTYPLVENATFTALKEEAWHLQDFLAPDQAELDLFPGKDDMKLLKISKQAKLIAVALLVVFALYSGYKVIYQTSSEAWSYVAKKNQTSVIKLRSDLMRYDNWNNLLKDRSKAWVSMELVAKLTPPDGSVILKDVRHTVEQKREMEAKTIGFTKSWIINGYSNEKGLEHLESLSTRDGVKTLFRDVAITTGNAAYLPDVKQRDITVSLRQRANPTYNTISPTRESDMYRRVFTLTISQNFSGQDDMAIAGAQTSSQIK
ncbi:MAG: hypothetical protein KJO21_01400 [Verrucomicrobiae bacterium]|nr:hypothetical protein [Verrucomicrobiae bacterium]NNJ42190.1 hypothetical protein [Akkermansiaceae bacterium]